MALRAWRIEHGRVVADPWWPPPIEKHGPRIVIVVQGDNLIDSHLFKADEEVLVGPYRTELAETRPRNQGYYIYEGTVEEMIAFITERRWGDTLGKLKAPSPQGG